MIYVNNHKGEEIVLCPWCKGMGIYDYNNGGELQHIECKECNKTGRLIQITKVTYKKINKKTFKISTPIIKPMVTWKRGS